jgi:prepilin-type N-terminal cleavage/methylation domain-containing protein
MDSSPQGRQDADQHGISMIELLVTMAIFSIGIVFASSMLTDFRRSQIVGETKSQVAESVSLAGRLAIKTIPPLMSNVVGSDGTTAPASSTWTCVAGDNCALNITPRQSTTPLEILKASCTAITSGTPLAGSQIFSVTNTGSTCLNCSVGFRPTLKINTYDFSTNPSSPTLASFKIFPSTSPDSLTGLLAMGVCLNMPAVPFNSGTSASPIMVNRYNLWTLTLIPAFYGSALQNPNNAADVNLFLRTNPHTLYLAMPESGGSGINYTPQ